jgi:hypothetical protein
MVPVRLAVVMSKEVWTEISVRVGNAIYKGQCRVDRNEVVVRRAGATRSAQPGSKIIKLVAEKLLRELVAEGKM